MSHLSFHLCHSSFKPWAQGGSGGQSGHVWWTSESLLGAGAHINKAASLQTEAWWSRQRNVLPGIQFESESSIIPIFPPWILMSAMLATVLATSPCFGWNVMNESRRVREDPWGISCWNRREHFIIWWMDTCYLSSWRARMREVMSETDG